MMKDSATMASTRTSPGGHLRLRKVKSGSLRLDRHSGSGRTGTPKKGGAGGKYTWGVAGNNTDEVGWTAIDKSDPNYSDELIETDKMDGPK